MDYFCDQDREKFHITFSGIFFLIRMILVWVFLTGFATVAFSQGFADVPLKYPWAGGLNSAVFGQVDLDLNGNPDLVIFDRFGNRILPFLQNGNPGLEGYTFHPEYADHFPQLKEWVQFVDYDCDGKQDILTYNSGGIAVFRNISDSVLKFQLITPLLKSFYYSGYTGILGTPVDYPAFKDIDQDGDPDLLTFFGLGSFVEYHKNLSVEKYGHCDSLDFRLTDNCWGHFKESEGGNKITLNVSCLSDNFFPVEEKHTGSTMLATDMNGDGLQDLLLGDVDFPNLILLINGGTKDSAHMVSIDSAFPGTSRAVNLFSFPSCSMLDLDQDGLDDLLISPFDPSYLISENFRSAWYYRNEGTAGYPVFRFINDRCFQDQMIDAGTSSYPVLFDIDNDGLTDLFIGNYGYYDSSFYKSGFLHSVFSSRISYYHNEGTSATPLFKLINEDFGGLSALKLTGLYPAFGDIDHDQDVDLLLGNTDGTIVYLENSGGSGEPPVFKPPVFNYQNIDVVNSSTPQLFDLNKDGLLDLVIGKREGTISYYRNDGTLSQPLFTLVTDYLGEINVTNPGLSYNGYSVPDFFTGSDNQTSLLVGSEEGIIHYFQCVDENLTGSFCSSDSLFAIISQDPAEFMCGIRVAPAIGFLSSRGLMDLIVGNFSGGLNYYTDQSQPPVISAISGHNRSINEWIHLFPNPADEFVTLKMEKEIPSITSFLLEVYNSTGTCIQKQLVSGNAETSVSTKDFPDGLFLFVLTSDGTSFPRFRISTKLVIRH